MGVVVSGVRMQIPPAPRRVESAQVRLTAACGNLLRRTGYTTATPHPGGRDVDRGWGRCGLVVVVGACCSSGQAVVGGVVVAQTAS
jgi:hypothetical protein